jgi:hypothetical protein
MLCGIAAGEIYRDANRPEENTGFAVGLIRHVSDMKSYLEL